MTRHLNQAGLLPQEKMDQYAIGIIGTGAIGSFVAMALSKMGFKNIVTWDHDKIEEHNIANQMFPVDSVGMRKSLATRAMVKQFSGEDIITIATKTTGIKAKEYMYTFHPMKMPIIILAVDSLDTRKEIVEAIHSQGNIRIIDARMGATTYRVMTFFTGYNEDMARYRATLVPDADAVQERCGQKSIIYTVLGVAAEVCNFVHKIVMQEEGEFITIPLPVIFDYGTGMRIQERLPGPVENMTDDQIDNAVLAAAIAEERPF
jgi:molybdopterin/thiamine biosynthesis adenylyltransferase